MQPQPTQGNWYVIMAVISGGMSVVGETDLLCCLDAIPQRRGILSLLLSILLPPVSYWTSGWDGPSYAVELS